MISRFVFAMGVVATLSAGTSYASDKTDKVRSKFNGGLPVVVTAGGDVVLMGRGEELTGPDEGDWREKLPVVERITAHLDLLMDEKALERRAEAGKRRGEGNANTMGGSFVLSSDFLLDVDGKVEPFAMFVDKGFTLHGDREIIVPYWHKYPTSQRRRGADFYRNNDALSREVPAVELPGFLAPKDVATVATHAAPELRKITGIPWILHNLPFSAVAKPEKGLQTFPVRYSDKHPTILIPTGANGKQGNRKVQSSHIQLQDNIVRIIPHRKVKVGGD